MAIVTLAYTIGSTLAWYGLKKTGLGRSHSVLIMYWVGAAVFFGTLWATRGVAPWKLRRETKVVVLSFFILLSLFWTWGRTGTGRAIFGAPPRGDLSAMLPFFYFTVASVFFRIACPLGVVRWLGWKPADAGYQLKGAFKLWWVYLALFLLILPVVLYASSLPAFLRKYPWCRDLIAGGEISLTDYLVYAAAMMAFYSSGEAFWRGFLLLGAERELGYNALFLMVMPYVLGHLGKPLAETLGAVAAGLILGSLALHHRSFWLGAATHWSVAMSMDLSAIIRRGISFV